ncbi:MAG: hypothetical protein ACLFRG_06680 [Desulfococcaceae bacterium]
MVENSMNQNAAAAPAVDAKIDELVSRYAETRSGGSPAPEAPISVPAKTFRPPNTRINESADVRSSSFNAQNLQHVVDEIKVIEDGIKNIIASRTNKVIEEKIPVERERPVQYNLLEKAMVLTGLKEQEMETYTDYEVVQKEVPRKPDEVMIHEFRGMIDQYIHSLKSLNEGLRETVVEVDSIVRNLTSVNDAFTDQIHGDRRAYNDQVDHSRELEKQLEELVPIHEGMSPVDDRYAEVEKLRDHLEMALRESQGMELKYKTNIDMGVKYQTALKSYRRLINDFKERGDLHVNMVDKFAAGAEHMKVAVENVSQICSGVARVTQSMVMIVESIEDGNKVLGRYASLVGDQMTNSPQWQMEYEALKDAEDVYRKNDELRLQQIQGNREEIERLIHRKEEEE